MEKICKQIAKLVELYSRTMNYLFIISIVICTVADTESYSWGLDRIACDFFTPSHIGKNRRPEEGYYRLFSERVMFSPRETVEIKVTGANPSDDYSYTGILMSVRKDGESYGTWEESAEYSRVDCSSKVGSAISEVDEFPKLVGEHVFKWTAPSECVTNEIYYVSATVVKSKRQFLDGLTLPLKCVLPVENHKNDSCSRKFHAIPAGANTSFEEANPGKWYDDAEAKIAWKVWKGETPSPGTGPKAAYDGSQYLYVESSFPARLGHQGVLVSPPGLAGCLCFRFAYHMYTDIQAKFFCEVNGKAVQCQHPDYFSDGTDGAPMDKSRDRWLASWISINEPGNVEIKIIAQRGSTFRGDMAVDNFTFTPGSCIEDEK